MKCEKSGNHTISYQSLLLSTTILNDIEVLENVFNLCMHVRSYPAAIVYLSKHMQYTMLGGE